MKDKIDYYLDFVNDCDSVTDDDLKQILEDKDLKETHRMVSKVTDALTHTPEIDIDREWDQFEIRNFHHSYFGYISLSFRLLSRNTAAAIICAVASLAVVAASIGMTYSFNGQHQTLNVAVEDTLTPIVNDAIANDSLKESTQQMPPNETIVFKNQSLEAILSVIVDYYGASINFKSDGSKDLRLYFQWNQSLPLEEIISQLNYFEQVNIKLDNNVITIE